MINELIPNISRHFLFSILEKNQKSGIELIETISGLEPELVNEFLYSFANSLADYFYRLESELDGCEKIRLQELHDLKNLHMDTDLEELD